MEKRKISAKIVADSVDNRGNRITSFILTYPRFIHSEIMTHRLFSRNAASSRAIPFKKMVEMVENDPFIPIAWQRDHKGMQGVEYLSENEVDFVEERWLNACKNACNSAKTLNSNLYVSDILATKQLCNRLLEPFQWYTCLVTATEYDNFYELRCPKYIYKYRDCETPDKIFKSRKDWLKYNDYKMQLTEGGIKPPQTEEEWWMLSESGAEIHIQALAEAMWDAQNESAPNKLLSGEYHVPFFEIEED